MIARFLVGASPDDPDRQEIPPLPPEVRDAARSPRIFRAVKICADGGVIRSSLALKSAAAVGS
jgi:hypothetical protein